DVRRVARAVPGELDALAPHLEGATVLEGLLRGGPGRVVVAEQEPPGLLVPDANDAGVEERGRASVIGVVVRVDEVGDLVAHPVRGRDLVYGSLRVVGDGGRRGERARAVRGCQELCGVWT